MDFSKQGMQIPTERVRQDFNDNENKDTLSNLPECVLLHILSFLNTKQVVRTCILSTRWKNLWKRVPALVINSHFDMQGFDELVSRFFSVRDRSTALQVLEFYSEKGHIGTQRQLEIILGYIVSHNVRRVRIKVVEIQHFPPCLFSCHNLTSLHISVGYYGRRILFPNSLNYPALTSLSLWSVDFSVGDDGRVEPFSVFNKLNSLFIQYCKALDNQNICISSATVTHLTIKYCNFELYTPSVRTFVYKGYPTVQQLCGSKSNLSSIKHVNIKAKGSLQSINTALILRNWLVQLANIESLTICSTALQILYLVPDILKEEIPSLCNLKSLKVKMYQSYLPSKYVDFFCQKTSSAKVEFIYLPS